MASSERRRTSTGPRRASTPRRRVTAIAAAALLALAGCGGHSHAKADQGLFDDQSQAAISCMAHQHQQPGPLYTGGTRADTAHVLTMLQYYTANGAKPYCDGKKPTAIDQAWGRLYVSLGGQDSKVPSVLASR